MKWKPKPNKCAGCPAFSKGLGFVPAHVPETPVVTFLTPPVDETEARREEVLPWVSYAGSIFRRWLKVAELPPERCGFVPLVACWLPKEEFNGSPRGTRKPTREEILFCTEQHARPALEKVQRDGKVIVTVGAEATRWTRRREGSVEPVYGTSEELQSLGWHR